jgi:hypothetical protein
MRNENMRFDVREKVWKYRGRAVDALMLLLLQSPSYSFGTPGGKTLGGGAICTVKQNISAHILNSNPRIAYGWQA